MRQNSKSQIRIDLEEYKRLEALSALQQKIAGRTGKPKSLCASLILELFAELSEKMGASS